MKRQQPRSPRLTHPFPTRRSSELPAAAPRSLWTVALSQAAGWTGYTHQWRNIDAAWSKLVMASADSVTDMQDAHALGYRTFRVTPGAFENVKGLEIICPASEEKGKATECASCRACMGTSGKARVSDRKSTRLNSSH